MCKGRDLIIGETSSPTQKNPRSTQVKQFFLLIHLPRVVLLASLVCLSGTVPQEEQEKSASWIRANPISSRPLLYCVCDCLRATQPYSA